VRLSGSTRPRKPTKPRAWAKKKAAQTYERLKAEWIERNPDASPEQYAEAMRAIARKGRT
jgi:hypothetical protein